MAIAAALLKKLVHIPMFHGLTVPEASEFFEAALDVELATGERLFAEGDAGDSLFVLLTGEVQISKQGVELAILGPHAVLGEMSLVGAGETRSADAVALRPTTALKLPSSRLRKLLKANNMAALKVAANVAQVLGLRLALINEKFVTARGQKKAAMADFGTILNKWSF